MKKKIFGWLVVVLIILSVVVFIVFAIAKSNNAKSILQESEQTDEITQNTGNVNPPAVTDNTVQETKETSAVDLDVGRMTRADEPDVIDITVETGTKEANESE